VSPKASMERWPSKLRLGGDGRDAQASVYERVSESSGVDSNPVPRHGQMVGGAGTKAARTGYTRAHPPFSSCPREIASVLRLKFV
jgi:hypothetical protein